MNPLTSGKWIRNDQRPAIATCPRDSFDVSVRVVVHQKDINIHWEGVSGLLSRWWFCVKRDCRIGCLKFNVAVTGWKQFRPD
ncbi:hypothetical protein AVEN_71955-1 [Araneus ventricosus]|uniref:Uncharacterized protein n=1 Tax=Araneus ventricosus TaxID=182803 RepID=A0A4Y2F7A6_ARAVE|nr:hypothetical protein AVEN_71955-1 [Araneus ventricosus]